MGALEQAGINPRKVLHLQRHSGLTIPASVFLYLHCHNMILEADSPLIVICPHMDAKPTPLSHDILNPNPEPSENPPATIIHLFHLLPSLPASHGLGPPSRTAAPLGQLWSFELLILEANFPTAQSGVRNKQI